MKVLIFGGTGAMGVSLVHLLNSRKNYEVYVTSRGTHNNGNVTYIKGNALADTDFVKKVLSEQDFDVLIDFMVYSTEKLKKRLELYLAHTKQYIFFSSSRVYASSDEPLVETSARLLDVCRDSDYLATDEYALAKAREENLLINNQRQNWTVIRPYITYNTDRIQLGVYEKENWLYRAMMGREVIFPKDIASKYTNLTFAPDVAKNLINLIGNPQALGQIFHIVNDEKIKWYDVADLYKSVYHRITGNILDIHYVDNSKGLEKVWNPWQIKYDRLYNRVFNSTKINTLTGVSSYVSVEEGLTKCLTKFLDNPRWLDYRMNWAYEGWSDKQTGNWTKLSEIRGKRTKLSYLKHRLL